MGKIPKSYRGWTRGYINFICPNGLDGFGELKDALANRGYRVVVLNENRGVTNNLPYGLPDDRSFTVVNTIVYGDPNRVRDWEPLIRVSNANRWDVAHRSSVAVQKAERKKRRKR